MSRCVRMVEEVADKGGEGRRQQEPTATQGERGITFGSASRLVCDPTCFVASRGC